MDNVNELAFTNMSRGTQIVNNQSSKKINVLIQTVRSSKQVNMLRDIKNYNSSDVSESENAH